MPHISASDKEAYSIYKDPLYVPLESLYAMQGKGIFAVPQSHISASNKGAYCMAAQKAWEAAGGAEDGGGQVSGGDVWNS